MKIAIVVFACCVCFGNEVSVHARVVDTVTNEAQFRRDLELVARDWNAVKSFTMKTACPFLLGMIPVFSMDPCTVQNSLICVEASVALAPFLEVATPLFTFVCEEAVSKMCESSDPASAGAHSLPDKLCAAMEKLFKSTPTVPSHSTGHSNSTGHSHSSGHTHDYQPSCKSC